MSEYNNDSNYTTNAPSYYDDLARKQKLIEELSKKIWIYDEKLDNYINIVDGKITIIDQKIGEGFNDEINNLLVDWINDGTLEHIINVEIFNTKVDKDVFNDSMNSVNQQLIQTSENVDKLFLPTKIVTDGTNLQNIIDEMVGGGTVIFTPNTIFDITPVKITNSNIHFTGLGAVIKPTNEGKIFEIERYVDNTSFSNLTFELGETFTNVLNYGIYGEYNDGVTLDNVTFKGGGNGLGLKYAKNVEVINCEGVGASFWHFILWGVDGLVMKRNKVHGGAYDGLKLAGTFMNEPITMTKNVLISDNECFNNRRDGLDIAINDGKNITITNNNFHDNDLLGIEVKSVYQGNLIENVIVDNNQIIDNGLGITFETQASNVGGFVRDGRITNNLIKSSKNISEENTQWGITVQQYGVRLWRTTGIVVENNQFIGYDNAVRLIRTENCSVKVNTFDKTRNGVRFDGSIEHNCINNRITDNEFISRPDILYAIRIADEYCINNVITNNVHDRSYSVRSFLLDLGTETKKSNNIIGYSDSIPLVVGSVGEVVINTNIGIGNYEKWVVVEDGNPATFKGVGLID